MSNWFRRTAKPPAVSSAIGIGRPWARMALSAPTQAGGFFTVTNPRPETDRLLSATSPVAESIQVHAIKVVGAGTRMRPLAGGLVIPAASTIELKPRGYHLLLTGLKSPLVVGGRLPVSLTFENAGRIDVELTVEAPGPVGSEILETQRG